SQNVNAAAARPLLVRQELAVRAFFHRNWRPVHRKVELSAGLENRVADLLRLEPDRGPPPQELVRGIRRQLHRIFRGRLPVGSRQHNLPMQPFDTPSVLDEVRSEPIEQFRMSWGSSLRSEIVGSAYDSVTEMILPDAVHEYPRGERMIGLR